MWSHALRCDDVRSIAKTSVQDDCGCCNATCEVIKMKFPEDLLRSRAAFSYRATVKTKKDEWIEVRQPLADCEAT